MSSAIVRAARCLLAFGCVAGGSLLGLAGTAAAGDRPQGAQPPAAEQGHRRPTPEEREARRRAWQDLPPEQRRDMWHSLSPEQRELLMRRVPRDERIQLWKQMTPEEREQMRHRFIERREQRAAESRQQLTPEERQRLREQIRDAQRDWKKGQAEQPRR